LWQDGDLMHLNSQLLFERFAQPHFAPQQRVLEIGPDGDPSAYRRALAHLDIEWETADLAPEVMNDLAPPGVFRQAVTSQHTMLNEYAIPVADGSFDVVIAGQVAEHVRRLWVWIEELTRVTRPGGTVVVISPISWTYHEAPIDCWRIYPEGMRSLCAEAGLAVLTCEMAALEPAVSRRQYFANSYYYGLSHTRLGRMKAAIVTAIGWPMPTALDLITVAQKPPVP
jgi:SAM-dependent methyltransferase